MARSLLLYTTLSDELAGSMRLNKVVTDNQRLFAQAAGLSGSGVFNTQKYISEITGRPALLGANRYLFDMAHGPSSVASVLAQNRRLTDMTSGVTSVAKVLGTHRSVIDAAYGPESTTAMLGRLNGRVASILGRPAFTSNFTTAATLAQLADVPQFKRMIGTPVMPFAEWGGVLDTLRDVIGDEAYEDVEAEFAVASDVSDASPDSGWWIARLPMAMQLFLLLSILEALDKAGEFLSDMTGQGVSNTYRDATQLVILLGFACYAFIEARDRIPDDDESDDS
jgi:hypothetical protein